MDIPGTIPAGYLSSLFQKLFEYFFVEGLTFLFFSFDKKLVPYPELFLNVDQMIKNDFWKNDNYLL